jgi:DNA polymerase-3 subunit epsilon
MKRPPPSPSRAPAQTSHSDTRNPPAPPPGPPWDLPLAETPFAFVDLEMTGLDVKTNRVIEICIVRTRGKEREDSLETLINPGLGAAFQTDVHGLNETLLENAPRFGEVADRIETLLGGAILVAHAAIWDTSFLEAEFERLGRPVDFSWYLDTLTLARRAMRADSYALQSLADQLGVADRVAHRAADDVRVLRALFDRVCAELSPRSARDLWHVRIAERHARPDILAACVALASTGEPGWVTYRPSHKTPRSFQAIIREVRTDLDPPRVLGYSLPGRSRFDLRTDRILSIAKSPPAGSPPRTP